MSRPRPFSFNDFRVAPEVAADAPRRHAHSAEELAAANAQGVIEGRRLAMESIAAAEAEALSRIGDILSAARDPTETAASRTRLIETAREFLEQFCAGLSAQREIEIAVDLLRRLIENSEDRRPARLVLNPNSLARLGGRLSAMLVERGVGEFVALAEDVSFEPGEARLEWRGGELRRGRTEIAAALAPIFEPLKEMEARS